jgi:NDP-sugar pyrophosphorylase family protein
MLNIVMPMAGRGSRFVSAGFTLPKPLIPVCGVPMTRLVIQNVRPRGPHRFIFLCLREHLESFPLRQRLTQWSPGCQIIEVSTVTQGAACTVLLARDLIDNDDPMMIANCDQWVDIDINDYLAAMDRQQLDGLIMTMWADDPKWSYVRFGDRQAVVEVVEKQVVSNEATVGIYNYRRGRDFVWAAQQMIDRGFRVNNEFYVAPAYNELIARGAKLGVYNVGREYAGMYGLGIPSDLEKFERLPAADTVRRWWASSPESKAGST